MAGHYTLNTFLRQANTHHIAAHLTKMGIDPGFDPETLGKRTIDPIIATLDKLKSEQRNAIEIDFQDIFSMASEVGIKGLYADAQRLGLDIQKGISEQKHTIDKAYWAFLHQPKLFACTLGFLHIDMLGGRSWKLRMLMHEGEIKTDPQTIETLTAQICAFFMKTQGCGRLCEVEHLNRGDKHYFHAFPEDFVRKPHVWQGGRLTAKTHRPAFELVFVYDPAAGLDIYTKGGKKVAEAMQKLFALVFFGNDNIPVKQKPTYAVHNLSKPNFAFQLDPLGAVQSIEVKQLRFMVNTPPVKSLTLDIDGASYGGDIPALIRDTVKPYPHGYLGPIVWARLVAQIDHGEKRSKRITFDLSGHSCNLKYDTDSQLIRDILSRSGIDTTAPLADAAA